MQVGNHFHISSKQPTKTFQPQVFKGLNNKLSVDTVSFTAKINNCKMFVFDLDGTFAHGSAEEIQKVVDTAKDNNIVLTYASSRTIDQLESLTQKLDKQGINLPKPDYYIAGNGQFIYKKQGDELVLNRAWVDGIKEKTGFDRAKVYDALKDLGHTEKYQLSDSEVAKKENLDAYKQRDPDFFDSKLSYYEFCPSDYFLEFMVAPGMQDDLKKQIPEILAKQGVKNVELTFNNYPKSNLDNYCSEDIKEKARPLRVRDDGSLDTIHIGAVAKGDAVEFLRSQLNIKAENIVAAGDDNNDKSLTNKGYFFIMLGNATKTLMKSVDSLSNTLKDTVVKVAKEGVAGIIEGLKEIGVIKG